MPPTVRPANKPELHSSPNGSRLVFTSYQTESVDGQLGHPASPSELIEFLPQC